VEQLIDASTGAIVVAKLKVADNFWRRLRGLQFQRELAIDAGLLLTPCRSIHTHWMRFAIDVIMLDDHGIILDVRGNLQPWKAVAGPPETRAILEVTAGSPAGQLPLGTRLVRSEAKK
jgi:uncharacterized membrane protein (UPF0127 family)